MNRFRLFCFLLGLSFFSCNSVTERIEGFLIHGIDVSHHQGKINWSAVAEQDIQFVFVKATEGESHVDSLFAKNWRSIAHVGLKKGAYHFFRPKVDPKKQAENFIKNVTLISEDLVPVVDVEVLDRVDEKELQESLMVWLEIVENYYGVKPIIYSNQKFFIKYLKPFVQDYPTWVARYNSVSPTVSYEKNWDFWQYGDYGQIRGIDGPVDLNVFRGSMRELNSFCIPNKRLLSYCE